MIQDTAIITERVKILHERAFSGISTTIAGAFIFAYIFRAQISLPTLFAWLVFMSTVALARYWLLLNYSKNKHREHHHDKFENHFAYAAGLSGIGWAFFIASGLNLPDYEFRIYSLLLLIAIVALAIPVFSSSIKTMYFYVTPSLIISIPFLLYKGGNDTALGLALVIFTVMIMRSGRDAFTTLNNTLSLRFQTKKQTESLEQLRHEKTTTELQMQELMDNSPTVIYIKKLNGEFSFVNQQFLNLFNFKRTDVIGKTLHDVFPKNIADEMRQNDLEVLELKKPMEYEETALHEDGPHNYISIKFPLFDEDKKFYAVGGISTDITERFRIEESLRISQQRLLLHREQSPVGVIEWNTDFEFIDWNPAAEKIFGFTKDEVQGHHITDRILPDSARSAVNEIWEDLLANKGGTYSLNENTTKDGRTILCEWHSTPLVDHDGKVIGVTSLVDDVTERQKHEENLRHSQKMDAIGNLTGGVAHDFNNMLGVVLGYSELIKGHARSDDHKLIKYNDAVIHAGQRAKKLTSQLLEFSRKDPSSAETTCINTLLNGMMHMLERTITPRIKLILELEENIWPIYIDKARLEDAVLNMSINAMHAMPKTGTLILSTRNVNLSGSDVHEIDLKPGNYVLLSVVDTGIGMSQDIQVKMFDPFFTTKGNEGTGLGMSQVYGFVQQSGGNIQVNSEPGHGTQISLYIPRHRGPDAVKPETNSPDSIKLPPGKETILVVDDEVALLNLNKEILTNHGYNVLRAESAKQALEILQNQSVDLLLSDVIMPGMDGYQLAAEVEKHYPTIKIQLASGFSDDHTMNEANTQLQQQRLHKPFSSETLLKRIRELLNEDN